METTYNLNCDKDTVTSVIRILCIFHCNPSLETTSLKNTSIKLNYQAEITGVIIMLLATGRGFYNNNLATDVDILVAIRIILPL